MNLMETNGIYVYKIILISVLVSSEQQKSEVVMDGWNLILLINIIYFYRI